MSQRYTGLTERNFQLCSRKPLRLASVRTIAKCKVLVWVDVASNVEIVGARKHVGIAISCLYGTHNALACFDDL